MSAFDPKRTLNNPICCDAQVQLYFGGMVGCDSSCEGPIRRREFITLLGARSRGHLWRAAGKPGEMSHEGGAATTLRGGLTLTPHTLAVAVGRRAWRPYVTPRPNQPAQPLEPSHHVL